MPAVRRALVLAIAALVVVPGAAHAATVTLAKVGDFAAPVYVTAPLGDTTRVFVVEKARHHPGARRRRAVDRSSTSRAKVDSTDNERGLLSMAFALDYLDERPVLRLLHGEAARSGQVDHRGAPRRPGQPRPGGPVVRAAAGHDPARPAGQPQRRPAAVRPRRLALRGHRRRRQRRRSQRQRADARRRPRRRCERPVNHDYRLGKLLRIDPRHGRRLDLRLRPAQPVALLLRPQHRRPGHRRRRPGPLRGGRLRRGAGRRRAAPTTAGTRTRGCTPTRATPRPAPRPGPSCPSSSTRTARRARSPAATWCATPALPELAGTYLYGDNCTGDHLGRHAAGGHARARSASRWPNVSSFGEDGCGRVYAASLGGAVYRFASSGACAGPAPFVGRLPAGVAAAPPAAGPDHRAPALTLLRAAARQHALRTGFVTIRVRCDELCTVTRERARAHHAPRARGGGARCCARAPRRRRWRPSARTTLRLKLSKATRRAIRRSLARPRAAGHGAHHGARRGHAGNARSRDAARADRPVVAAQLPPGAPASHL